VTDVTVKLQLTVHSKDSCVHKIYLITQLEVLFYHLSVENVLFNECFVIQKFGIGMLPIPGFGIGNNDWDSGSWDCSY